MSRSGIITISHSQDTAGPMARTVTDAAILLGSLTGVDPRDPITEEEMEPDEQLMRAIETVILSGVRISDLHAEHRASGQSARDDAVYLVVDPGDGLASRIETRVDAMLGAGWADEVRNLIAEVPADAPAWKASGYAAMRDHVEGRCDLSTARQRVIIETRQYAKRQRTWFRHQLPATAVTPVNPEDSQARAVVREWWERAE